MGYSLNNTTGFTVNNCGLTATSWNEPTVAVAEWKNDSLTINADVSITAKNKMIVPTIAGVIYRGDLTIVLWSDKTKTLIRCCDEEFDKEKGLAMAIVRKMMSRNDFKRLIDNAQIQEV